MEKKHHANVENYLAHLSPTGQAILQILTRSLSSQTHTIGNGLDSHIIYKRDKRKQEKILTFGSSYKTNSGGEFSSPVPDNIKNVQHYTDTELHSTGQCGGQDSNCTVGTARTIHWDNMFDTECFTNIADSVSLTGHVITLPSPKLNNIDPNEQAKEFKKKTSKHAYSDHEIICTKKAKKTSNGQENKTLMTPPISYRKQVYTKTVNNWLQDNQHRTRNTTNKKLIQTRLANKGGIMKFGKPDNDVNSCCVTTLSRDTPDTCSTLKSHFTQHRVVLTLVLIYSGCCQLTRRNLDDTKVEGLLLHVQECDMYYLVRGATELATDSVKDTLQTILLNADIICYEAKHILMYLRENLKLDINTRKLNIFDAKIAGSLLHSDASIDKFESLLKMMPEAELSWATSTADSADVLEASCHGARALERCIHVLKTDLMRENLMDLFVEIEMKVTPIIADMESGGVLVDLSVLKQMEGVINEELLRAELACHRAAGRPFQVSSSVQVRRMLYDELQLRPRGHVSTSEVELRSLAVCHPLPGLVLRYRQLNKARSTFLAGVAMQECGGRVRPSWVQTAASTGRIASNNPNLQAIPKTLPGTLSGADTSHTSEASELSFRSVYVSGAGRSLLSADFRHLELRILAHLTGDPELLRVFALGDDVFRSLAATWLQKSPCQVSSKERERGKRVVYAALYGAGTRKLMDILQLTYERTLDVLSSFNRTFPCVRQFCSHVVSECVSRGCYAVSLCGRRRHLPRLLSTRADERARAQRQAVNFVLQGSAADLCKAAMVATDGVSGGAGGGARLLLQIHDELLWELDDRQFDTTAELVKSAMESCGRQYGGPDRLPVRLSRGRDWGHMTPLSLSHT